MPKQLTLAFPHENETTFESFHPGDNHLLLRVIKNFSVQSDIFGAYLWGGVGAGKTHLLQAACSYQNQRIGKSAVYLSLRSLKHAPPHLPDDLESLTLVCIDDIDEIVEDSRWEEALFHFYNRMQGHQGHLLFSGRINPQNLSIRLPDLKSRITASFVMEIKPVSDEEKSTILQSRAKSRGFDLSEDVIKFLINHFPRDMKQLVNILNRLDEASLAEKRRVTIPLVKKVIIPNDFAEFFP